MIVLRVKSMIGCLLKEKKADSKELDELEALQHRITMKSMTPEDWRAADTVATTINRNVLRNPWPRPAAGTRFIELRKAERILAVKNAGKDLTGSDGSGSVLVCNGARNMDNVDIDDTIAKMRLELNKLMDADDAKYNEHYWRGGSLKTRVNNLMSEFVGTCNAQGRSARATIQIYLFNLAGKIDSLISDVKNLNRN
jgi:hypothetical protein